MLGRSLKSRDRASDSLGDSSDERPTSKRSRRISDQSGRVSDMNSADDEDVMTVIYDHTTLSEAPTQRVEGIQNMTDEERAAM